MVVFALPDALQDGDVVTAEDQETPGPETVQVAFCPFTPVALQLSATDCPERTRLGVAVRVRFGVLVVHQFAVTDTFGQYDTAEPDARTFIAYVPGVVRVRVTVAPVPTDAPSDATQVYGADAPFAGFAL